MADRIQQLTEAVQQARTILGDKFNANADRAKAYMILAEAYKGVDKDAVFNGGCPVAINTSSN